MIIPGGKVKSFLPSLSDKTDLPAVLGQYSTIGVPLIHFVEVVMRKDSELSIGERELIAAYVSSINACKYCADAHVAIANQFDIPVDLLDSLIISIDDSELTDKQKVIFRYVKKLTETPSKMTAEDADLIYQVGWGEEALVDAVAVCALFNCMNRLVDGLGCIASVSDNSHQTTISKLNSYLELVPE